jgi:SAM-dependent methyltransferase
VNLERFERKQVRNLVKKSLGIGGPRPKLGAVRMGDLNRTKPIDGNFGFGRGTPVDRYYIEHFIEAHGSDIQGHALEIGDATYCNRFGSGVSQQEILHISAANSDATIIGDLSTAGVLTPASIDAMVLTQTLHLIYDMRAALRNIYEALAPGGVALVTVPGITPVDRYDWGDCWYWSLTEAAAKRLFGEVFEEGQLQFTTYGNVYAATCFLHGLALEEVDKSKLLESDPAYPVVVAIRAQKGEACAG